MSKTDKNVIIFGESGSGKSSLVNLLLGKDEAEVSSKAVGCTFKFQTYKTPNFTLHDTVGLSEGDKGKVNHETAIKMLISFLKELENGVSLLIFVIEKGRIKKNLNDNYKLFVEGMCMNKVPVVLVITHCEMEGVRGSWWEENQQHFQKYGMKFSSVVSGSALQPYSAPALMQEVLKEKNNETVTALLRAMSTTILKEAWKVEGGWDMWFSLIVIGVMNVLGSFFPKSMSNGQNNALENGSVNGKNPTSFKGRLAGFLKEQGYDSSKANDIVDTIAAHVT